MGGTWHSRNPMSSGFFAAAWKKADKEMERFKAGVVNPGYCFPKPTLLVNVSSPEHKNSAHSLWICQITNHCPSFKNKIAACEILGEQVVELAQGLKMALADIVWQETWVRGGFFFWQTHFTFFCTGLCLDPLRPTAPVHALPFVGTVWTQFSPQTLCSWLCPHFTSLGIWPSLPHLPGTPFWYFPWKLMIRIRYTTEIEPNGHLHFWHGDCIAWLVEVPSWVGWSSKYGSTWCLSFGCKILCSNCIWLPWMPTFTSSHPFSILERTQYVIWGLFLFFI